MSVIKVNTIQNANGTTGITFAANGQMTLANTPLQLTGGQIKFPGTQIASADGNTLDDYEEGTWTPTLTVGTCENAGCVYTKIGRFVTVSGFLHNFSDRSSASTVQIEGLPFPYANIGNGVSFGKTAMYRYINSDFTMYMSPTSSALTWYVSGSGAYGTLKYSDLNNSAIEVYFSFAYMTS